MRGGTTREAFESTRRSGITREAAESAAALAADQKVGGQRHENKTNFRLT